MQVHSNRKKSHPAVGLIAFVFVEYSKLIRCTRRGSRVAYVQLKLLFAKNMPVSLMHIKHIGTFVARSRINQSISRLSNLIQRPHGYGAFLI